jgi:thiol-disulfide isomerase/thioredoxin
MSADDKCALVDNTTDLDKALKEKDNIIALVYASWCPFCKRFLPIFQQYAQEEQRYFLRVQDDRESIGDKYSIEFSPLFFSLRKVPFPNAWTENRVWVYTKNNWQILLNHALCRRVNKLIQL